MRSVKRCTYTYLNFYFLSELFFFIVDNYINAKMVLAIALRRSYRSTIKKKKMKEIIFSSYGAIEIQYRYSRCWARGRGSSIRCSSTTVAIRKIQLESFPTGCQISHKRSYLSIIIIHRCLFLSSKFTYEQILTIDLPIFSSTIYETMIPGIKKILRRFKISMRIFFTS